MTTDDPLDDVRGVLVGVLRVLQGATGVLRADVRRPFGAAITEQWEGFAFVQQMLADAVDAIQQAIDAGDFPPTLSPNAAMHLLWGR